MFIALYIYSNKVQLRTPLSFRDEIIDERQGTCPLAHAPTLAYSDFCLLATTADISIDTASTPKMMASDMPVGIFMCGIR